MRLTRETEIAIGVLVACARARGRTIRTIDAAKSTMASKDYTAQVVLSLVHEGFLKARRGRNGGLSLALPSTTIRLGDVLRRMQPDLGCHANIPEAELAETAGAAFKAIVGAAEATFLTFMDRFTVADLVSDAAGKRIDCLDCEMLNPARRKRDKAEPFTATLYHQEQSALRPQDETRVGLIVAKRARTERSHHHASSFR